MAVKLPILDIKNVTLRRIALVTLFIPIACVLIGGAYVLAVPVVIWGALKAAVEGFAEEWSFQFHHDSASPLLTKMFTAAWKADWRNSAD